MGDAFRLEEDESQIATLTFDLPDAKVNTLSLAVLGELEKRVDALAGRNDLKGLLLKSGKPGQFVAGADLKELAQLAYVTKEQAKALLAFGHGVFSKISKLPFPTVALIDGACLGGGCELVLSMDERIAADNPKTQIGLPETTIGIIPGWGGTQRMPRLIGVHNAIEMICSGDPATPAKARTLGLVFDAVPGDRLVAEGKRLMGLLQESGDWKRNRERRSQPVGLSADQAAFMFASAEGFLYGKTKGQYPAPLVALKAIKEGCNLPLEGGLQAEQACCLEVMGSPIAANLISIFFMTKRLEKDPGVADPSIKPADVQRAGVLGAGLMGSGIATAHARTGVLTTLVDVDEKAVAAGMKRVEEVVMSRIKIGRAQPQDMVDMLERINKGVGPANFANCDFVIEAIVENEDVKKAAYRQIGEVLKPDAILATNTSTISISRLAEAAPSAEHFVGMHFFNPVDRMKLVEVIRGEKTSDQTVATAVALAKRIKKTPIVVKDCAGFLVNRVLFPYLNEAVQLLLEGNAADLIDKTATDFGMPMGPILLQDVVGLDTSLYGSKIIAKAYPDRATIPPILGDLVKAGRMGQKAGAGFRKFGGKSGNKGFEDDESRSLIAKHQTKNQPSTPEEIVDRLFLPMLLEATRVLEEGIVREPADVDMGLVLGIGFPPFRGGILRWCDSQGASAILQRIERYASLGKRFEPTESLRKLAQTGGRFYPSPK